MEKVFIGIPISRHTIGLWFIAAADSVWLCELHHDGDEVILYMFAPRDQEEPAVARAGKPVAEMIEAIDSLYRSLAETATGCQQMRILMSDGGLQEFIRELQAQPWFMDKMRTLH